MKVSLAMRVSLASLKKNPKQTKFKKKQTTNPQQKPPLANTQTPQPTKQKTCLSAGAGTGKVTEVVPEEQKL